MSDVYYLKLPLRLADFLEKIVEIAEKESVLTLFYEVQFLDAYKSTYVVKAGSGKDTHIFKDILEDPCIALAAVGMLQIRETNNHNRFVKIYLTDKAFAWVHYHKMNAPRRWLKRHTPAGKDIILAIVTVVTTGLAVLQIIQLLGLLNSATP